MEKELYRGSGKPLTVLLEEARQGSREALGEAIQRWRKLILQEARRRQRMGLMAKCSPSDVAQETLLDACRDFEQFRGASQEEFVGWLLSILAHKFAYFDFHFRHTQKRQVGREVPLDDPRAAAPVKDRLIDPQPSPASVVCREEDHQRLRLLLERLPVPFRRVIRLRDEQGLEFEEIGTRFGCSAEAARKFYTRAVRRLAGLFEGPTG